MSKDIEQEKQDITIERNRISEARANVGKELQKLNKEIKDAKNSEIKKIKKEFILIEEQLVEDRKRLDTFRQTIYTDIDNAYSNIKKEKELQLEYEISEDRKRLDKVRFDLAEQIAIEEANLLNKKPKSLI